MDDTFHFALLRISIAQILKANGFDKCKPSVLNVLTDIYINYLKKLVCEALKCSQLRTKSNHIEVQDVTESMILVGFIKPENYLRLDDSQDNELYNAYSMSKVPKSAYNTKSLDSFVNWIKYSESFRVSRRLNELPPALMKNLIEKRKLDLDDGETDQEKKKRKYKERQDYYNLLKLNELAANTMLTELEEEDDMNEGITEKDNLKWLNFLIEKDLKLGHDLKFVNTSLFDEFMKFQSNPKFHPTSGSNKNTLFEKYEEFKHYMQNASKFDHVVLSIEDPRKDGTKDVKTTGGQLTNNNEEEVEESVVRPSESLEKLLPYNMKYDSKLEDDSPDQYIQYAAKHHPDLLEANISTTVQDAEPVQFDTIQNTEHDNDNFEVPNDDGIGGDNNLMFL